jgi:hypothetical protein
MYCCCFSYGLDVNVDRAEDVLLHRSLLDLARDPDKRPVYHIRLLEVLLLLFNLVSNFE